jgi:hypothetical protein
MVAGCVRDYGVTRLIHCWIERRRSVHRMARLWCCWRRRWSVHRRWCVVRWACSVSEIVVHCWEREVKGGREEAERGSEEENGGGGWRVWGQFVLKVKIILRWVEKLCYWWAFCGSILGLFAFNFWACWSPLSFTFWNYQLDKFN